MMEISENPDQEYQQGYNAFLKLYEAVSDKKDLNEAQTRFEIIDTILFDCLGWSKYTDIKVEDNTEKGYADYIISTSRNVMVVEAKRESIGFELPISEKPTITSIPSLIKENSNLKKAVHQAQGYSQAKGVPVAVVTNGYQFVAFVASRTDGQSPTEGQAIIFTSLQQIRDKYITFWNYFSRKGMIEEHLTKALIKGAVKKTAPKPASSILNYPGIYTRNSIQNDLMVLSEIVLEDLNHEDLEKEFLENCYCESGALSQYSVLARDLVRNRYEQLEDSTGISINRVSSNKGTSREFLDTSASRRPIILMGGVGVGKTTFIRNLILSDKGLLGKNDVAIHVNLGENAIMSSDVKTGALTKIKEILTNDYNIDIEANDFVRGVYKEDLKRMRDGIYKDLESDLYSNKEVEMLGKLIDEKAEHIKNSWDYIETLSHHKTKTKVVIFLDNADQRSSQDQQEIFLISHELASQCSATIFVSIRPETFYLSHKEGVLKAYHPKVFTIEPPRIDLVLQKRIKFGLRISRGEIAAPNLGDGQMVKLANLTTMLGVMLNTLESSRDEQKRLLKTIDNVAAGNVRSAIDMVKNFLSSSHTNTRKILDIEKDYPGTYVVPLHEFMKSLIYGDYKFYNPTTSIISNVFGTSSTDPKEHFLKLSILNELVTLGSSDIANHGFLDTKEIYSHSQSLGYLPEQIEKSIDYCLQEELVENPINSALEDSSVARNALRITTKGGIYVQMLSGDFLYLDAMLVDTPILDSELFKKLDASFNNDSNGIDGRLDRAEEFTKYLKNIYEKEIKPVGDVRTNSMIDKILNSSHDSVQRVKRSVQYSRER